MYRKFCINCLVATVLCGVPVVAGADPAEDFHITDDSHATRIDLDRRTFEEFKTWFDEDYPPATVMLHALSLGIPLEDAVYMAVKADPSRDLEMLRTAESLSSHVPGWLCYNSSARGKYTREISPDDLGPQKTLARVAQLYRDERKVLAPFPDWLGGGATMNVAKDELIGLVGDRFWYRAGPSDGSSATVPARTIFAVIGTDGEITIDGDLDRINSAPGASVPVVVVYMRDNERVIGRYRDDVTVAELLGEFVSENKRVAPVVHWSARDFHKIATPEELRDVVALPDPDTIPADEFARIESEILANGNQLNAPLKLTFLRSGNGQAWLDKPAVATVAESLGVTSFPVVLFYHAIDRQPCGAPATCLQHICDAAIAGGARHNICQPSKKAQLLQGGGGGTPPPSPPVSN